MITTSSLDVYWPSSTVSVTLCVPMPSDTVGCAPVAIVLPFSVHVYVSGSLSGSLDAEPSRLTLAECEPFRATLWSGPASAVGGRLQPSTATVCPE